MKKLILHFKILVKNKILKITKEELVSIDFNHNPASSIVDLSLTNIIGKNMGKISAWYDNEAFLIECVYCSLSPQNFLMNYIKDQENLSQKHYKA